MPLSGSDTHPVAPVGVAAPPTDLLSVEQFFPAARKREEKMASWGLAAVVRAPRHLLRSSARGALFSTSFFLKTPAMAGRGLRKLQRRSRGRPWRTSVVAAGGGGRSSRSRI